MYVYCCSDFVFVLPENLQAYNRSMTNVNIFIYKLSRIAYDSAKNRDGDYMLELIFRAKVPINFSKNTELIRFSNKMHMHLNLAN